MPKSELWHYCIKVTIYAWIVTKFALNDKAKGF